MSGEDVSDYPEEFDAGINEGLGLAPGVYRFAFDAETEQDLLRIRDRLRSHGVAVRGPVDHEGWSKSIYFPRSQRPAARGLSQRAAVRRRGREAAGPLPPGRADEDARPEGSRTCSSRLHRSAPPAAERRRKPDDDAVRSFVTG